MKYIRLSIAVAIALLAAPSYAQEGCTTVQASCSQMNARCESNCQNAVNPSACVARVCSVTLTSCKANGVWRSPTSGAGCFRTNNRT